MQHLGRLDSFSVPPAGLGLPGRNLLINGNFSINQRGYGSGGSLAANAYGHDRWKNLGAGAGSYSFTQSYAPSSPGAPASPDTTITIPSGTTIGQVVEAAAIGGGTYTLAWSGTATAGVYYYTSSSAIATVVSGATSPVTFTLPAGAYAYVGFTNGTLARPQLEQGSQATPFDRRHPSQEVLLCQRYYFALSVGGGDYFTVIASGSSYNYLLYTVQLPVYMRATPTITYNAYTTGAFASGYPTTGLVSPSRVTIRGDTTAASANTAINAFAASAEL